MLVEPGSIVQGLDQRPRLALRARDSAFLRNHVQDHHGLAQLLGGQAKPNNDSQAAVVASAAALHARYA